MKIIEYIKKIKEIIIKYEISLISSSTAFYMIIALYSLSILLLQFYNNFNDNGFIINKLIDIINPYYLDKLEEVIPIFSINKFSPVFVISLIWSSSKFINGFNKASDIIYNKNKKRNFLINRISSVIIFIIILFVISFEIITIIYANKIVKFITNNIYIYMFIQFIIDIFLILTFVILVNIYSPPVKMSIKKVYFGSFLSTFMIYIITIIFIVIVNIIKYFNVNFHIFSLISFLFFLIYLINYSIVLGIYINYHLQKQPN